MSVPLNCEKRGHSTPAAAVLWILFCAFCNCAGWLLSAIHQLNALGYLIIGIFAVSWIVSIGLYRLNGYDRLEMRVASSE